MALEKLVAGDGSWTAVLNEWTAQCRARNQDFEDFAVATLGVLGQLAEAGHTKSEVYGYFQEGECLAVCEANHTQLPGIDGYVLRVRNMTLSPRLDFDDVDVSEYGKMLMGIFVGILRVSHSTRLAPHIKFHLRSPSDRSFFATLAVPLSDIPQFDSVAVKGAWLYVTKKQ